jgi:hypothetical protein
MAKYMTDKENLDLVLNTGFLEGVIISDPGMGYLETETGFENVNKDYSNSEYFLITNLETSIENARKLVDMDLWELEKSFNNNLSIGEIYRRK